MTCGSLFAVMDIAANDLPDDLEAARALLLAKRARAADEHARHLDAQEEILAQQLELQRLKEALSAASAGRHFQLSRLRSFGVIALFSAFLIET